MRSSDYLAFLAAGLALTASVYLWFTGRRDAGVFVGLWVPSILAFASYVDQIAGRKR